MVWTILSSARLSLGMLLLLLLPNDLVHALSCYKCLENQKTAAGICQVLDPSHPWENITCPSKNNQCMVARIVLDNVLHKFERSCSDSCKPSCKLAKGHESCVSCCSTDFCNVGNSATLVRLTNPTWWILSIIGLSTLIHVIIRH